MVTGFPGHNRGKVFKPGVGYVWLNGKPPKSPMPKCACGKPAWRWFSSLHLRGMSNGAAQMPFVEKGISLIPNNPAPTAQRPQAPPPPPRASAHKKGNMVTDDHAAKMTTSDDAPPPPRRKQSPASVALKGVGERARLLKPLADEAHKILVIGRETGDTRLISLSAEVMGLIMEAL